MTAPILPAIDAAFWRNRIAAFMLALSLTLGMIAGGALAFCGIAGGITLYLLACVQQRMLLLPERRALLFGGALLILALLTSFSAFAPERSWVMSWRLLTIIVPLMLLFAPAAPILWPRWFARLVWAVLAIELLLIAEFMTQGGILLPLFHFKQNKLVFYNRGLAYAAVLIWPLCAMLLREQRRWLALALIMGLAVAAWLSPERSAPLALAAGGVFALLTWRRPRLTLTAGLGLLLLTALLPLSMPWIFADDAAWLTHLPPSWQHRFEIWDYMLRWGMNDPWFGHGLDAAGVIPVMPPHMPYRYASGPAAHPHHMALQLWLELGLAGWLWGMALALILLRNLLHWPIMPRAAGMASWAAMVMLSCGAFSLWTDSWLALGAITIFWLRQLQLERNSTVPEKN